MLAVTPPSKVTTVVSVRPRLLTWAVVVLAQEHRVEMVPYLVDWAQQAGPVPKTTTELERMNSVAVAVGLEARPVPVWVVQVAAVTAWLMAPLGLVPSTRGAVAVGRRIRPLLPLVLAVQES
jgi:hypothetical protein